MAFHLAALLLLLLRCDAKYLSVPVFKQGVTGRFVAKIFHGPDQQAADLVLDLGSSVTGLDCRRRSSSTHLLVSCPSLQCSKAGGSIGKQLVEDVVAVGSVDSVYSSVDRFLFHCMPNGVLGLGRSKMSLPSQFSMTHFLDRKFAICLSASGGRLLIGDALAGTEITKTLIHTPLLTSKDSHRHSITVKSIKVGSVDPGPVKVNGRARLSTTAPYTTLRSSIYQSFTKKFVTAVVTTPSNSNATEQVSVWPPFKTCFAGITSFPEVDLVLQSDMVKWRVGKTNAMVVVDKEKGVNCLGILEGGVEMDGDEIVIGRHQLEENLMEFDMGRSMLGFRATSCAELKNKLDSGSSS